MESYSIKIYLCYFTMWECNNILISIRIVIPLLRYANVNNSHIQFSAHTHFIWASWTCKPESFSN